MEELNANFSPTGESSSSNFFSDFNLTREQTIQLIGHTNGTMNEYVKCLLDKFAPPILGGCKSDFDGLLCWNATEANTLAVLPCLPEIKGIKYNTSDNVSRWCHGNGTWNITDYSECREVHPMPILQGAEITTTIYFVGYISSLVALTIAMWIFLYFKDLRCLRNVIHTNLMCTYILTDLFWILTLTLQIFADINLATCVFLITFLNYFILTNFFWMFVEGLYLYMLVVETFTGENIKLRVYATIGWGCPAIFIIIWAIVKTFAPDDNTETVINPWKQCPWMRPHMYDWIHHAPAIGVLLINLIFLFVIMWVLITKLRSAQTVETQQYRKAAKALLVLIPLLGITYVLLMDGPHEGVSGNIYGSVRAILISTQGFTVALFYCFLNTEVQNTIRHHKERWKTARSFRGSRRYTYSGHSKDWSPRSRTESIRLYSQPPNYRKRESSASEITTTTLVNVNGGSRLSNGSQARSPFLHPGGSDNV